MLPDKLVNSAWSLAPGRACLTFSAKVDASGKTVDTNISAGRIHNIISLNPQALRSILFPGVPPSESPFIYAVGEEKEDLIERITPGADKSTSLTESQKDQLRSLLTVTRKLRPRLLEKGVLLPRYSYGVTRQTLFPADENGDHLIRPKTDPSLVHKSSMIQSSVSPAQVEADDALVLVKAITALASEVAAEFCASRNIPGFYQVGRERPATANKVRNTLADHALKQIPPTRPALQYVAWYLSQSNMTKMVALPDKSDTYTTMPATSPLRRYTDLVCHWQIQEALMLEASSTSPVIFKHDDPRLPFSHSTVKSMLPRLLSIGSLRRERTNKRKAGWLKRLLIRSTRFGEDKTVPVQLKTLILRPGELPSTNRGLATTIDNLVIVQDNELTAANGGLKAGEWWLTEIHKFLPLTWRVEVVPTAKLGVEGKHGFEPVGPT